MFRFFGAPYQNLAVQESWPAAHPSLSVLSSISHCEDLTHTHVETLDCMPKLCSDTAPNNYCLPPLESNSTCTCIADHPWGDTSSHSSKNGQGIPESWVPSVCGLWGRVWPYRLLALWGGICPEVRAEPSKVEAPGQESSRLFQCVIGSLIASHPDISLPHRKHTTAHSTHQTGDVTWRYRIRICPMVPNTEECW